MTSPLTLVTCQRAHTGRARVEPDEQKARFLSYAPLRIARRLRLTRTERIGHKLHSSEVYAKDGNASVSDFGLPDPNQRLGIARRGTVIRGSECVKKSSPTISPFWPFLTDSMLKMLKRQPSVSSRGPTRNFGCLTRRGGSGGKLSRQPPAHAAVRH